MTTHFLPFDVSRCVGRYGPTPARPPTPPSAPSASPSPRPPARYAAPCRTCTSIRRAITSAAARLARAVRVGRG